MTGTPVVRLEATLARGWRGTTEVALGGWVLRAADGFTSRANSVLPAGPPDRPLPAAVEAVSAFYRARGLAPLVQVGQDAPGSDLAELDAALRDRGWSVLTPNLVMTAEIADLRRRLPEAGDPDLELMAAPDDAWLAGYRYRDTPLPAVAREVLLRTDRPVFAAVRDRRGQAGVGRAALAGRWAVVGAVMVAPDRRREGVGTRLMAGLTRWAGAAGAEGVALQVDAGNDAALELYRGLGLTVHHGYHYRRAPDGAAGGAASGTLSG